ncbi:hypothetical protein EJ02DRAFT_486783 [Clathrospora elynae]|uniref:Zn(2)-C6 fungal-type domain-containing protein n=1 Tax=Clathrospora elynae TaxID=706981 RepID=A0A6A5S5W4_9PLEO|nr:hypothetical protein EJ02DRAFT_486783 [Clathrospora elynae]
MNSEISRRSACDRCRGQKLRCVREVPSRSQGSVDESLTPCDRCLKAGAECFNGDYPRRRLTGDARAQNSSASSCSSHEQTPQNLLPRTSASYSAGSSFSRPPTRSDSRRIEDPTRFDEMANVESLGSFFPGSVERPSKRRSLNPSYKQLDPSFHNLDPGRYQNKFAHPSSGNDGASSSNGNNSLSLGQLDNGPLNLDTSLTKITHHFNGDTVDFGMCLDTASTSHPDGNSASLTDALLLGSGDSRSGYSAFSSASSPPLPTMNSPGDCLHCLSDLCSRLLRTVNNDSNLETLGDILSYNPHLSGGLSSPLPKNAIGQVLESSQLFLDILSTLRGLISPKQSKPSSPANSECSYSDLWDSGGLDPPVTGNKNMFTDNAMAEALLSSASSTTNNTTPGHKRNHPATPSPPASTLPLDIPTTFIILTCYIWLLRTYDTIFSRIYACLSSEASTIPSIMPGLIIGGFNLCERKDLQVDILIQLSTHMLERIEETLGISAISSTPRHEEVNKGLLDSASSSAVLDLMFRPKSSERPRAPRLKETMDDVREALRRSYVRKVLRVYRP